MKRSKYHYRRFAVEIATIAIVVSYVAVIGEFYNLLRPVFYILLLTIAILSVAMIFLFEQQMSKKMKTKEIEKTAELRILKTKLNELQEAYKKQKALLESEDGLLFATSKQKQIQKGH